LTYRIPGVANEFWPAADRPPGGENYGWGATLPMFILRNILGFRERPSGPPGEFVLAPTLPPMLAEEGKTFTVKNLRCRRKTFDVSCRVLAGGRLAVTIEPRSPARITLSGPDGVPVQSGNGGKTLSVEGPNGALFSVRLD